MVGFDDILAGYLWPPLTTVHQGLRRHGRDPVRALVNQFETRTRSAQPVASLIPARLVLRQSTSMPGG